MPKATVRIWRLALALVFLALGGPLKAQEEEGPKVGHGSSGFFIETADGAWRTALQFRLQFRFSTPFDNDPVTFDDYTGDPRTSLEVNRARLKVRGHGFKPWLGYYMEYELAASVLLNWELTVQKNPALSLRVGQWKAYYTRERVVSSGRQQLVDRSLINRYFTIDRQQGVSLFGRVGEGSRADFQYWLSAFTGLGRGGNANDDGRLMYMARVQWNPMGRSVAFRGSELSRESDPTLSVAVAGATNRSGCTRFSTSGCGSLEGFPDQDPGRYRVGQALFETAFNWRGFQWSQEAHWKRIRDRAEATTTDLVGNYIQVGYFPSLLWSAVPEPMELAFRWATYRPDVDQPSNRKDEFSLAANWFFSGHDNKLSAELSWLTLQSGVQDQLEEGVRLRVQWEIQF
ncbi:MAG: porin [Gemmatimonadota bacterium]|jgi:phosphate-selective porin OprO/OprP